MPTERDAFLLTEQPIKVCGETVDINYMPLTPGLQGNFNFKKSRRQQFVIISTFGETSLHLFDGQNNHQMDYNYSTFIIIFLLWR